MIIAQLRSTMLTLTRPGMIALRLLILAALLSACARPECHNTNPVFDQHSPYSKAYQDELLAQLQRLDPDEVRYWIDTYEGLDGQKLVHFYVQGGDLCAKAIMTIPPDPNKRWPEKKGNWKNGLGSRGAEVLGLKYDVLQTSEKTELVFRGWERMID